MKLEDIFREKKAEALLITDPYNMRYISGFRGGEGMLFLTRDRRALITDSRYTEAASQETDFEVIEENRGHRRTAILRELFSETGAEAAGYEDQSLRCSEFAVLRNALPEVKHWIPLGGSADCLRRIKPRRNWNT